MHQDNNWHIPVPPFYHIPKETTISDHLDTTQTQQSRDTKDTTQPIQINTLMNKNDEWINEWKKSYYFTILLLNKNTWLSSCYKHYNHYLVFFWKRRKTLMKQDKYNLCQDSKVRTLAWNKSLIPNHRIRFKILWGHR